MDNLEKVFATANKWGERALPPSTVGTPVVALLVEGEIKKIVDYPRGLAPIAGVLTLVMVLAGRAGFTAEQLLASAAAQLGVNTEEEQSHGCCR